LRLCAALFSMLSASGANKICERRDDSTRLQIVL
jgi:hypothetical protein